MIATVDISVQAANPSMPLFPMRAFEGSPSSIRVRNVPKRIGDWVIDKVYFAVTYPDNTTQTIECKLVGGVYVGTVSGCATIGDVKNGYSIFADGKDENGNAVTDYCLGKGDVQILDASGITQPLQNTTFVQILSAHPTSPNDGDMWQEDGAWYVWQDGQAWAIGDDSGRIDELSTVLSTKLAIDDFNSFKSDELTAYALSADVQNELATKADVSSLDSYAEKSELSDGSFIVKKADGSTSSEKLVNSLSDEHQTRIFIDEHDNVIVQKYVQSGWYVDHVEVNVGGGTTYNPTTDYWCTVDVKTTTDGLVFTVTAQDYARTLNAKSITYTSTDQSITEQIVYPYWLAAETGDASISLKVYCEYSATPIWVNVSRLVPDGSKQSGLRAAQIAADGTFVTSDQVEPLGYMHYAKGARDTLYMFQPNSLGTGQNRNKWVQIHPAEGKLLIADSFYPSWFLSKYNGTTIDPPIEMKWGYYTTTTYYNRRLMNITLNSWAWVATTVYPSTGNTRNRFYIKATANDDGLIQSIDDKLYVSTTAHDITFSSNNLSIETFDGSADLVECTRASDIRTNQYKYFVLEEDLSAELSTKQDKLTDVQLSSIDYVANEQMTTIKFIDGTSEKVEIVGEIYQVTLDPFFGRGMTDIKIGTLVNAIGNDAFDNFSDLSNVFIPETVRIIDDYAFVNAPALSTLTIPNSVSSIGIDAFHENLTVTFIGKTMNEVSSMANYSWGLNTNNIKTWNAASQEWVKEYIAQYLQEHNT